MLGATVPKASADLHDDLGFRKNHVVPASLIDDGHAEAVTQASVMQLTTERQFRGGVDSSLASHPSEGHRPRRGRPIHRAEKR